MILRGQDRDFYAHIVYKNAAGDEIADVGRGTWLPPEPSGQPVNFQRGITHELPVLFLAGPRRIRALLRWRYQTLGMRSIAVPEVWPEADRIDQPISSIEARLFSGSEEPLLFDFDLRESEDGGPPSLLRRD
jgi:hypothetical protein